MQPEYQDNLIPYNKLKLVRKDAVQIEFSFKNVVKNRSVMYNVVLLVF